MHYDAIIVGGGIAGLQSAIQLGRYMHKVLVVDSGKARSLLCRSYRNVLGWPDGISGKELRELGRRQAERLGVRFREDEVIRLEKMADGSFAVHTRRPGDELTADVVLLATGVTDRFAPLAGLAECLGLTVFICPDCDGYEALNRPTVVIGAGNTGASMALAVHYWTDRIVYVNHEQKPVAAELAEKLAQRGIELSEEEVERVLAEPEGRFTGVKLKSGAEIAGERAFVAFGGNEVHTSLARALGAERMENGHLLTDPRTKMTSVDRLWAAGDIAVHSEMLTVAMADGTQAAVWMHKALLDLNARRRQSESAASEAATWAKSSSASRPAAERR